jgi:hypothetical protein
VYLGGELEHLLPAWSALAIDVVDSELRCGKLFDVGVLWRTVAIVLHNSVPFGHTVLARSRAGVGQYREVSVYSFAAA